MLPTPALSDAERGASPSRRRRVGGHQVRLSDAASDLAAVPPLAPAPPVLLPTPLANDATKGSTGRRGSRGDPTLAAAVALLPIATTAR
ncbi:hypothetical protein GCM10023224_39240 [Streptomonospora halophila]|uniref:Uncharacterized protein n=1 Tax=Streptomonospora halophila TaxID=427369 RepID=A0ABP9GRN5_9ACTN